MQSNTNFSEEFYESVVAGLKNVIGESPMKAAIYHIGFSRSTASPEEFSGGLRRVFGPGSAVLEKIVAKELYQRLGLRFQDANNFDFASYVKRAREAFAVSSKGLGNR